MPWVNDRHPAFMELTASRETTKLISFTVCVCYTNMTKDLNRSLTNHVSLGKLSAFPDPVASFVK